MRQTFDETTDPSFGAKHLPLLRARMAEQGLDGFLIPHEDEHQNEYLPDANERLAWAANSRDWVLMTSRPVPAWPF